MRNFYTIILFLGWFAYINAGTVEGTVKSGSLAVPYAVSALRETSFGAVADSNGKFLIKDVGAGKYILTIMATGYLPYSRKITVGAEESVRLSIDLTPDPSQLEEVVISGTLREQSLKDSPIPIEILTPKLFQKNPTPSLFDAMSMVNGVQPQLNCSVCNTGDIHINGMEGPYTMITIDGMPIVSSLSTVYGLSGIPNSIVQRIEVVKGPAGTLYGSEAVGGLINVITKPAFGQPRFSVDVNATSYKDLSADVSGAFAIGKKITSMVGLNYFYFDERWDINKDNFTDITLQNRFSIFNKWNFEGKEGRMSSIALRYVYEDRFGGELQWNKSHRGSDSVYGESIYTRRFELIGNYRVPVKENIHLQYSWNYHLQDSYYGTTKFYATQQVGFAQLLWDKRMGDRHHLLAGLPVRFTYYDDNSVATQQAQEILLPGIFVQDEWDVNGNWKLLPGLRYDYNTVHGSIFSPRFAAKLKQKKNAAWRLSLGNGYRVVNLFTEDHSALTGSREVVIKSDLKPERSWNGILSYSKMFLFENSYLNIDANVFNTYFTNKIVGDFLSDPEKIIYDNLHGYAISRGQAANIEWTGGKGLKVLVGYTLMEVFQMNEDSAGKLTRVPQLYAPPFTTTFAISYKIPKTVLNIDLTGKLNSPMYLPVLENDFRPSQSPWFCIANIQLSGKIKPGFEFYGGVKNLLNFLPENPVMRPFDPFDKNAGDTVSNPNGYTFDTSYNYAPMQGIRFFAGIRYAFK
jgi:outer membrane receptor for ferrienterochelin and colicins